MTIAQDLKSKMANRMHTSLVASKRQETKNKTRSVYFKGKADAFEQAYNIISDYERKHSRK